MQPKRLVRNTIPSRVAYLTGVNPLKLRTSRGWKIQTREMKKTEVNILCPS